jgi:16S rRNA (cytosine967-C5)-methyltransferase
MKNKGRVLSLDVEDWKLEELRKRAKRAGVNNIEARLIEKNATIANLDSKADKLLLDVPCSGLGVLKRNPDAKWKLSTSGIAQTIKLQEEILENYSKMLKPEGQMIYSTCSILPSENQVQVDKFLNNNRNYELLNHKTLLPSLGFDGFYMALIKRKS